MNKKHDNENEKLFSKGKNKKKEKGGRAGRLHGEG